MLFSGNESNSIKSFIWPKETFIDLGSDAESFIEKSGNKDKT